MLRYSARKIIANHPPIYSTLNPETNSDSPSAKSKGERLVSAKHEINQMKSGPKRIKDEGRKKKYFMGRVNEYE